MVAAAAGANHSYRYHHRRRRGHYYCIASTIATELSEQELENRFFSHFKSWTRSEKARHINS
jgi:hypothetical protein